MPPKLPVAALFAVVCLAAALLAGAPVETAAQERPWSVTPCQAMADPTKYDETMITVPGAVTYGPGEFVIHGYDCSDDRGSLRLEFGGQTLDPKDRFRVSRERLEAATVPLKKDADYDTFEKLQRQAGRSGKTKMWRATIAGRFFAGPLSKAKTGGTAHPNARLVISEVNLVSDELEEPVDFSPLAGSLAAAPPKGCSVSEITLPSREEEDKLQRQSLQEEFAYLHDPKKVAAQFIAQAENIPADSAEISLKPNSVAPTLADYTWIAPDGLRSYNVAVNRPYWLLQTAVSGDTVIWAPKRVVRTDCPKATPQVKRK